MNFDPVATLKLFRFPLLFTAIADSAAGYLLVGSLGHVATLSWLALCSTGLCFFGMATNGAAGGLSPRTGYLSLLLSLLAALMIGYPFLLQRMIVWGSGVVLIILYNFFLRHSPIMGLVRASTLLLGISTGLSIGPDSPARIWAFVVVLSPIFLYVSALTELSASEVGGIDRPKLAIAVAFMALAALLAAGSYPMVQVIDAVSAASRPVSSVLSQTAHRWYGFVIATLLVAWIVRRAWTARDRKGIMLLVRDGTGGIILLDAALVASLDGWKEGLAVASLLIPAVIFKKLA